MKKFLVTTMTILLCASTYGQARKCTGPDGRVTYSDVVCSTAGTSQTVNTNANTVDRSPIPREIDALRAAITPENSGGSVRSGAPQDCKFAYYTLGDDKGKRLSDAAKAECLANNQAKLNGGPTSLEAYGFWRDHRATKVTERQAAIGRAQASAQATQAAQAQINSINTPRPRLTCKPSSSGRTLECE